ncbi:hypothetical protein GCM10028818_22700 [Spirosoma horti]
MTNPLLLVLIFVQLLISFTVQAQRRLPYPILFVHGFAGTSASWQPFLSYLSTQTGMYAAAYNRLDYCLNSDGNQAIAHVYATSNWRSDILDYNLRLDPSDLYFLNFDTCPNSGGSNRSAAVKQGYAVGLAVARILAVTGSDKVILMGHSMGGLAIREYLQTSSHWAMNDNRHHVAKVVTVDTPHGGSNLGLGDINIGTILGSVGVGDIDERSEAVRDLRYDYRTGYKGVYLFGGVENDTYIRRGLTGSYYNNDVNCNGRTGEMIQGLNQKSIPNDLDYSVIIGNWIQGVSDGVVNLLSQNLNNFYTLNAPVFYHGYFHNSAIKDATFPELYALDEPAQNDKAYTVGFDQSYLGLLTVQANGSWRDIDRYRYVAPGRGVVTAKVNVNTDAGATSRLLSAGGQTLASLGGAGTLWALIPNAAENYLEVEGTSGNGWRNYYYDLAFCSLPADPMISVTGKSQLCTGETTTLTATPGYDSYVWNRDGTRIDGNSNQLLVSKGGNYTVQGVKCGLSRTAGSSASISVYPKPNVPTISLDPDGRGMVSSAPDGNQWYINGSPITGATSPLLSYSLLSSGAVSLEVSSAQGCRTSSAPFVVTANEPLSSSDQLTVTPNPASGVVRIKTDVTPPYALTVTNLAGQKLWSKVVTTRDKTHSVDVSGWPAGTYLLQLESEGGSRVTKLLVH